MTEPNELPSAITPAEKPKRKRRTVKKSPDTTAENKPPTKTISSSAKQEPEPIKELLVDSKTTAPQVVADTTADAKQSPTPAPAPEPESAIVKWEEPKTDLPILTGSISIDLPFCVDNTIIPRRRFMTAIREMTAKQRFGFQVLLEGMKDEKTNLQMGGRVTNHVNALRALLEKIADAVKTEVDAAIE